jgi:hypothetical protein
VPPPTDVNITAEPGTHGEKSFETHSKESLMEMTAGKHLKRGKA